MNKDLELNLPELNAAQLTWLKHYIEERIKEEIWSASEDEATANLEKTLQTCLLLVHTVDLDGGRPMSPLVARHEIMKDVTLLVASKLANQEPTNHVQGRRLTCLTGQEWYSRFENELPEVFKNNSLENKVIHRTVAIMLEAARAASRLEKL